MPIYKVYQKIKESISFPVPWLIPPFVPRFKGDAIGQACSWWPVPWNPSFLSFSPPSRWPWIQAALVPLRDHLPSGGFFLISRDSGSHINDCTGKGPQGLYRIVCVCAQQVHPPTCGCCHFVRVIFFNVHFITHFWMSKSQLLHFIKSKIHCL